MSKRSNGVKAAKYVTHVMNGEKTLCGRPVAKVNCQAPDAPVNTDTGTCAACAKKAGH